MRMRLAALLAVSALLLAGCSGNAGKKDPNEDVFDDDIPTAEGKGLIRGLVLTPALVPVPDVTVRVTSLNLTKATDANGAFVFPDLEPGTYFVEASKPGWSTTQQSTDVKADDNEPPIVKMAIDRLPGTEPRAFTLQQEGFIACSYGTPLNYGSCAFATGQDESPNLYFAVEGKPSFVQTEIRWDSTQPSGDWFYVVQGFCSCDGSVPGDFDDRFDELPDASSPHIARANQTFLDARDVGVDPEFSELVVSVSASGPEPQTTNGSGVAVNQKFTVYATFFYNIAEPDPAWSFGANGEYVVS